MAVSNLPAELYSPEQIEAVLFELDSYLAQRRREETRRKVKPNLAKSAAEVDWTSELEGVLGAPSQAATLSVADLEAKVAELKSWRNLPVVHLTLPVRPPASLKKELVAWFRNEISPQLLIRFNVNSGIVGGIVVRTPQHIHDFSFRRLLVDKQSKIPEILKRPAINALAPKSKGASKDD